MGTIRSFTDTSAVSLAYALDDAADASEVTTDKLTYLPFTQEGFQLSKDSQMSTAIRGDRRPSGSKNTKGTAAGSAGLEFGVNPFCLDMLKAAMMSDWIEHNTDPAQSFIVDGETKQYLLVEKRVRNVVNGTLTNFFERYYGNLVNEVSVEMGGSNLVTMSANTMAVFGDTTRAPADSNSDAGGLVSDYVKPEDYEIADASNNIKKVTLFDANGDVLPVTFSTVTLTITNNVREQEAVGSEFAGGMGMGKVNAKVSGTIYYYDDSILDAHLRNKYVSAEIVLETIEGSLTITLPMAKAEAPNANAGGENQDYTQNLTLNAEAGEVEFDGVMHPCVLAIKLTEAEPASGEAPDVTDPVDDGDSDGS